MNSNKDQKMSSKMLMKKMTSINMFRGRGVNLTIVVVLKTVIKIKPIF